jgi:hypothetical protein
MIEACLIINRAERRPHIRDMLACVEDERHIGVVALVANGL